ncbi:MAG: T9SS type A sorting domain-containing protein [Dysgonamonadaceae bacterium]|jgi:hypothetical protein|nr:T9SS type A sorting domain-containing protein [Dysgonamonadaceae bacterium]
MKKIILVFFCIAGFSALLHSQEITIRGNKFYAGNKEIFFNGVNTAWQENNEWRLDFLGRNFNASWWKNELNRYVTNHINSARIWIHGGGNSSPSLNASGYVTGASDRFWKDMDSLVVLARERKLYIMPTLWSFDMCKNDYNAVNWQKYRDIINDAEKTRSYCENFLVPFVQRYQNEPYVLGYDLCNEPEHLWRDNNCGPQSRDNVIRFLATCAAYLHKNTTKPVTVGCMWIICNSDKYKSWTGQDRYAGNNYSNASLQAQYNDPGAYLDFYSPHWYQWQTSGSYFTLRIEQWMDDASKPALIGETPGYDVNENGWNSTLANMYIKAHLNDYAGVMAWKNPKEDDGYGKFATILPATNAFYDTYPELVYPENFTGIPAMEMQKNTLLIFDRAAKIIRLESETPFTDIRLWNVSGQLIRVFTPSSTLNVSDLSSGVYILQIRTGNRIEKYKLILN